MKIVLIHPDADTLKQATAWLEQERHHAVLAAEDWPEVLLSLIARHEPDLVLLPEYAPSNLAFVEATALPSLFPECRFRRLPRDIQPLADGKIPAELEKAIREEEEAYNARRPAARPYAAKWCVVQDPGYKEYASAAKLHVPTQDEGREEPEAAETARFLRQLQAGVTDRRHERAKGYLSRVLRRDRGLRREAAYRIAHGSYKIAWLRENIFRWLAVLAHYVPGAELEHCLAPQGASPVFAYLHHEAPMPALYPYFAVSRSRPRRAVLVEIRMAVVWQFEGQPEDELVQDGIRLFGLNAYLREVAQAQVRSMEQFLDPQSTFHTAARTAPAMRRTFEVFLEFWGCDSLRGKEDSLREITLGFHSGALHADNSAFCSFRWFRDNLPEAFRRGS